LLIHRALPPVVPLHLTLPNKFASSANFVTAGILTQEEFDSKKTEVLARI